MLNTRLRATALVAVLALSFAAIGCEQGQTPGEEPGPDGPGQPGQGEVVDRVIITEETEPQFYELRGGRYRITWSHRGCSSISVALTHADGTEHFSRTSRSPNFSALVNELPAGTYEYAQTDAACEQYEIRLDRL